MHTGPVPSNNYITQIPQQAISNSNLANPINRTPESVVQGQGILTPQQSCACSPHNAILTAIMEKISVVVSSLLDKVLSFLGLSNPNSVGEQVVNNNEEKGGLSGLLGKGLSTLSSFVLGGPLGGIASGISNFGEKIVDKVGGFFKKIF